MADTFTEVPDNNARDDRYAALIENAQCDDVCQQHQEADRLLCELLDSLGFIRTTAAFRSLKKWYE